MTLGADSIAIDPGSLLFTVRQEEKLFRLGDMICGYSGSFAVGDAIKYGPPPPPREPDIDPVAYMHHTVLPAFRQSVEEANVDAAAVDDFRMMVGYAGRAFLIEGGLSQLGSSQDGVEACGVGDTLAIGAALALAGEGLSQEEWVLRALAVAEQRSAGVRGPFRTLTLGE